MEECLGARSLIISRKWLIRHTVQKHEAWVHLSFLIQSFMQEPDPLLILFFELTLNVLILYELQLFLLFLGCLLHARIRHLRLFCHLGGCLDGRVSFSREVH